MKTRVLERPKTVKDALLSIQKVVRMDAEVPFDMLVMEASIVYKNFANRLGREEGLRLVRAMIKTGEWTTVAGASAAIKLDEQEILRLIEIAKSDPLKRKG
ncbi:MAG: hypothetical protein KGH94_02975 [Candidatus Micrarchaeota archaeon]|nr:hypothetical protein [Candidatus Micrarchaeota archaeon]